MTTEPQGVPEKETAQAAIDAGKIKQRLAGIAGHLTQEAGESVDRRLSRVSPHYVQGISSALNLLETFATTVEPESAPIGIPISIRNVFGNIHDLGLSVEDAELVAELLVEMRGPTQSTFPWLSILTRKLRGESHDAIAIDLGLSSANLTANTGHYFTRIKNNYTPQKARELLVKRLDRSQARLSASSADVIQHKPNAQVNRPAKVLTPKPARAAKPAKQPKVALKDFTVPPVVMPALAPLPMAPPLERIKTPEGFETVDSLAVTLQLNENGKTALRQFLASNRAGQRPHYEVVEVARTIREFIEKHFETPSNSVLGLKQAERTVLYRTLGWSLQGDRSIFRDPVYAHDYIRSSQGIDYDKEDAVASAYERLAIACAEVKEP